MIITPAQSMFPFPEARGDQLALEEEILEEDDDASGVKEIPTSHLRVIKVIKVIDAVHANATSTIDEVDSENEIKARMDKEMNDLLMEEDEEDIAARDFPEERKEMQSSKLQIALAYKQLVDYEDFLANLKMIQASLNNKRIGTSKTSENLKDFAESLLKECLDFLEQENRNLQALLGWKKQIDYNLKNALVKKGKQLVQMYKLLQKIAGLRIQISERTANEENAKKEIYDAEKQVEMIQTKMPKNLTIQELINQQLIDRQIIELQAVLSSWQNDMNGQMSEIRALIKRFEEEQIPLTAEAVVEKANRIFLVFLRNVEQTKLAINPTESRMQEIYFTRLAMFRNEQAVV